MGKPRFGPNFFLADAQEAVEQRNRELFAELARKNKKNS